MRIKTALLLLLILLQLPSCNKRYAFVRKVRVPHTSAKEISKAEPKKTVKTETIETAGADSTINLIETPPGYLSEEPGISHNPSTQKKQDKIDRPSIESKKQYHSPKPYDLSPRKLNKKALVAFILSILAAAAVPLIFAVPVLGLPLAVILSTFAFVFGQKSLKEFHITPDRGKWMATVGLIVGALILSGVTALSILFIATLELVASNQAIRNTFIILTSIFFTLMMYLTYHVNKRKIGKAPESLKHKHTQPGSWNKLAIAAFAIAILGLSFLLILALAADVPLIIILFTLLFLLAAIILGVFALSEIKANHQKGKLLAWIAILLVPMIILPPLALLILYILFILWLIKVFKRRKARKAGTPVSLS